MQRDGEERKEIGARREKDRSHDFYHLKNENACKELGATIRENSTLSSDDGQ